MRLTTDSRVLNRELARELQERKILTPPGWAPFVKTGSHRERSPQERDWWYHRGAAILRSVALKGPVGTGKLAVKFGGRKNRGVKPDAFRTAGTNTIRKILQQLERAGLVKQAVCAGHKGRVLTREGTVLLKNVQKRVAQ